MTWRHVELRWLRGLEPIPLSGPLCAICRRWGGRAPHGLGRNPLASKWTPRPAPSSPLLHAHGPSPGGPGPPGPSFTPIHSSVLPQWPASHPCHSLRPLDPTGMPSTVAPPRAASRSWSRSESPHCLPGISPLPRPVGSGGSGIQPPVPWRPSKGPPWAPTGPMPWSGVGKPSLEVRMCHAEGTGHGTMGHGTSGHRNIGHHLSSGICHGGHGLMCPEPHGRGCLSGVRVLLSQLHGPPGLQCPPVLKSVMPVGWAVPVPPPLGGPGGECQGPSPPSQPFPPARRGTPLAANVIITRSHL